MASTSVFDDLSEDYGRWVEVSGRRRYDDMLALIPESAACALDAGCGPGLLTRYLAERCGTVCGIDLSDQMLATARRRLAARPMSNVLFVRADLELLPFHERKFDLIVSFSVLRLVRPEVVLPGLRRMMRPGGTLVLHDHVSGTPRRDASRFWQVARVLGRAPSSFRSLGLRTALRDLRFRLRPGWIRNVTVHRKLTAAEFEVLCERFLPGAALHRWPWAMIAVWRSPAQEDVPDTR